MRLISSTTSSDQKDPRKIACSLKHSVEQSNRRKGTPYQSAMSMLNFHINRAGKNFPKKRKRILENAKQELREIFWPRVAGTGWPQCGLRRQITPPSGTNRI
jgi:Protein of unknown function (DUF3175)